MNAPILGNFKVFGMIGTVDYADLKQAMKRRKHFLICAICAICGCIFKEGGKREQAGNDLVSVD
jgi:hypothetical protein